MKNITTAAAVVCGFIAAIGASPAEGQGLFGRKKKEPVSPVVNSGLFPDSTSDSSSDAQSSSSPSAPEDSSPEIFRSGQPEKVEETSYSIIDGVKVEKKKGLFGWKNWKRSDSTSRDDRDDQTARPDNDVPSFDMSGVPPRNPTPQTAQPSPAPSPAPAPATTIATPAQATPQPMPDGEREKKFSFPKLSLFNKEKEPPRITPDAEVLINQDGVLVNPAESGAGAEFAANLSPAPLSRPSSGTSSPPREVNGSIVYESWDDINYKRASAADQIVREMKAQEEEYNRKVAEAQRQMKEQMEKAREEARIRAMLQGGSPGAIPGGVPVGAPPQGF